MNYDYLKAQVQNFRLYYSGSSISWLDVCHMNDVLKYEDDQSYSTSLVWELRKTNWRLLNWFSIHKRLDLSCLREFLTKATRHPREEQPMKQLRLVFLQEETLRNWLNTIHDNELSSGDRLQRVSCGIQSLLDDSTPDKYLPHNICDQQPVAVAIRWPQRRGGKWHYAGIDDTVPSQVLDDPKLERLAVVPHAPEIVATSKTITKGMSKCWNYGKRALRLGSS